MKNAAIILLLCIVALLAVTSDRDPRAAIEDTTVALHPADYQRCVRINTGPLKPKRRINGAAPVSEIT